MDAQNRTFDVIGQLAALRRYARALVRNPDDAEDLVHDALVKAYEKRVTFRKGANLRNWLLSIVHNAYIDGLRHKRALQTRIDDVTLVTETASPANQDQVVRLRQVRDAFRRLPDEQRAALSLVAIEDLSYQDAAKALGIPMGTLMSRISRARAQLRAFEETPLLEDRSSGPHLRLVGGNDNDNS